MKPLEVVMLILVIGGILLLPMLLASYSQDITVGKASDRALIAELQNQNEVLTYKLEECRRTQFKVR
jgi:hypothetical protein